jgi:hypothetical protein
LAPQLAQDRALQEFEESLEGLIDRVSVLVLGTSGA